MALPWTVPSMLHRRGLVAMLSLMLIVAAAYLLGDWVALRLGAAYGRRADTLVRSVIGPSLFGMVMLWLWWMIRRENSDRRSPVIFLAAAGGGFLLALWSAVRLAVVIR